MSSRRTIPVVRTVRAAWAVRTVRSGRAKRDVSSRPDADSHQQGVIRNLDSLPIFLTVEEVASILRTSRGAIYMMVSRGQLPGVMRIGRRVRVRRDILLDWLRHESAPSLKE